jgi:hypothetical protein
VSLHSLYRLEGPTNGITSQFGATIMDVSYGITVKEVNDPYIALAEGNLKGVTESNLSGHSMVDLIPPLKYVPSWFPGGGWKKEMKHYADLSEALCNKPFDHVKEQVVRSLVCSRHVTRKLMEIEIRGRAQRGQALRRIGSRIYGEKMNRL